MKKLDSLGKAVGKLLIGRVPGIELDDDTKECLQSGIISGITLFKENAQSIAQLLKLSAAIHDSYKGTVLISVDQEGGAVQRFDCILSPLPSAMALASQGNLNIARESLELNCKQLRLLGINCLLSPVLDISSNPRNPIIGTRSFGSEPSMVTTFGLTTATTAARFGIMAVGKHFPGHGETHEDSHSQLAVNHSDATTLWQRELIPFRGCAVHLPAIMIGHVWLPAVDHETLPATLSAKVITGLLREYLQYEGLIMTDDLLMKAITDKWGLEEAAIRTIAAGAEQLLTLGSAAQARSVHNAIIGAVKKGRIMEWQIEQAAESVERSRRELTLDSRFSRQSAKDLEELGLELESSVTEGKASSLETSALSIAMLRGNRPELNSGKWIVLAPEHERYGLDLAHFLQMDLAQSGKSKQVKITSMRYPLNPSSKDIKAIVEKVGSQNCIYLTYRALSNTGQVRLGRALSVLENQQVAIACEVPYDLIGLPDWNDCMATFDPSDLAMEALSRVLIGDEEPKGTCPVTLITESI